MVLWRTKFLSAARLPPPGSRFTHTLLKPLTSRHFFLTKCPHANPPSSSTLHTKDCEASAPPPKYVPPKTGPPRRVNRNRKCCSLLATACTPYLLPAACAPLPSRSCARVHVWLSSLGMQSCVLRIPWVSRFMCVTETKGRLRHPCTDVGSGARNHGAGYPARQHARHNCAPIAASVHGVCGFSVLCDSMRMYPALFYLLSSHRDCVITACACPAATVAPRRRARASRASYATL